MKTVRLRTDLHFVSTLLAAAALAATGSGTVDAQVLPVFPGVSLSGGCGNSSRGVPSPPRMCTPYPRCKPHGLWQPTRGRFGDTAAPTSRQFMFDMSDNSFVQMPQMIQLPPIATWVPSAGRTVNRTPRVEAPLRAATGGVVRSPIGVRIVPKARQADSGQAPRANQPTASRASRNSASGGSAFYD